MAESIAVTREEWLSRAAQELYGEFIEQVAQVPEGEAYQISCGWPSSRPLSDTNKRLGECWPPETCEDGKTHNIFVSPFLEDAPEVLAVLAHELVHVVVGAKAKHGSAFKRVALAIGLEGKMTATYAGQGLAVELVELARELGPYPHRKLTGLRKDKKQTTRMLKTICAECGYTCRVAKAWLDIAPPVCPTDMIGMEIDDPD